MAEIPRDSLTKIREIIKYYELRGDDKSSDLERINESIKVIKTSSRPKKYKADVDSKKVLFYKLYKEELKERLLRSLDPIDQVFLEYLSRQDYEKLKILHDLLMVNSDMFVKKGELIKFVCGSDVKIDDLQGRHFTLEDYIASMETVHDESCPPPTPVADPERDREGETTITLPQISIVVPFVPSEQSYDQTANATTKS